jgi:hypothetical protein
LRISRGAQARGSWCKNRTLEVSERAFFITTGRQRLFGPIVGNP